MTDQQDDSLPLAGTVLVEERSQYGSTRYYPANKLAEAVCLLTNTRTVMPKDFIVLKDMGFTVITTGAKPRRLA